MDVHSVELPGAVVVGVDGSRWSLNAVSWAVAEAITRGVPLRLVHAVRSAHRGDAAGECDAALVDAYDTARSMCSTMHI